MQAYFVLLLVAAASATPVNPNLLKHKPNNLPVLNLNHKNVHLTHQVPVVDNVEVVAPYTTLNTQVVKQVETINKPVVPEVYTTLHKQVVPEVYTTVKKQVAPQLYTVVNKEITPQVYTQVQGNTFVPQVYSVLNKNVVPAYTTLNNQVYTQVNTPVVHTPVFKTFQPQAQTPVVQTPVFKTIQTVAQTPVVQTPVFKTVAETPVELTPGYVAANQGAVHTAPLPEGPSNDGFFASHHINLPNQKA